MKGYLRAACAMAAWALLAVILASGALCARDQREARRSLADALRLFAAAAGGTADVETCALERISESGALLWTGGDPLALPGEADIRSRPEINGALALGAGKSERAAGVFAKRLSMAARLNNGDILCASKITKTHLGYLWDALPGALLFALSGALLASRMARSLARRAAALVNRMDPDHPDIGALPPEYRPLGEKLQAQSERLRGYLSALTDRQAEFDAITRDMSEAMVVVNRAGEALTMNRAATMLFGADGGGKRLLSEFAPKLPLVRDADTGLVRLSPDAGEIELGGKYYQLFTSPVIGEAGSADGVMLLFTDVTDRYLSENTRREFTANVSHELKTPLTAILGYAEIMKNGIAPEEMLREFAGRIHFEATRLIKLVEDILHLSRLDEGGAAQREEVGMLSMAREIARRLSPQAEAKSVRMRVEGDDIRVTGEAQMLEELLYNLIDNAIKYNVEGGAVVVRAASTPEEDWIEVEDTGIGIDPMYHERIFERFFRVDKSRSKQIGGTGLGLSIVKHAAMHHHARTQVDSAVGRGTRIRVIFSKD